MGLLQEPEGIRANTMLFTTVHTFTFWDADARTWFEKAAAEVEGTRFAGSHR